METGKCHVLYTCTISSQTVRWTWTKNSFSFVLSALCLTSDLIKCKSSVHSILNKSYNKGKRPASKVKSSSSSKDSCQRNTKEKALSVICVDAGTISIPKDKTLLRQRGMMKCIEISPDDSAKDIEDNQAKLFRDKSVKLLRSTKIIWDFIHGWEVSPSDDLPVCDVCVTTLSNCETTMVNNVINNFYYFSASTKCSDPNPAFVNPKTSVPCKPASGELYVFVHISLSSIEEPTNEVFVAELFDTKQYRQLQEDSYSTVWKTIWRASFWWCKYFYT